MFKVLFVLTILSVIQADQVTIRECDITTVHDSENKKINFIIKTPVINIKIRLGLKETNNQSDTIICTYDAGNTTCEDFWSESSSNKNPTKDTV